MRAATLALAAWLATGATTVAAETQLAQLGLERLLPGAERPAAAAAGGPEVPFVIRFAGAVRGLEAGAAVEINGLRIGAVRTVALEYDSARARFVAVTEIGVQPALLPAIDGRRPRDAAETYAAFATLVRAGMRARLGTTRLVGGDTVVSLALGAEAGAALGRDGSAPPEIPSAATRAEESADRLQDLLDRLSRAPVEAMVTDLQEAMAALKAMATGPELREALAGLKDGTAELRTQVARLGARTEPLIASLNETVRSANRTIDRATQTLGTVDRQLGDRSPLLAELHAVLREMNGAARSLRLMAEYLERNPDALLRGKTDNRR